MKGVTQDVTTPDGAWRPEQKGSATGRQASEPQEYTSIIQKSMVRRNISQIKGRERGVIPSIVRHNPSGCFAFALRPGARMETFTVIPRKTPRVSGGRL